MTRIAAVAVFAVFIIGAVLGAITTSDEAARDGGSRANSGAEDADSPQKPAAGKHRST